MKKIIKKRILTSICAAAVSLVLLPCLSVTVKAAETDAPVSVGLYVLAEQNGMAKAALIGKGIQFSRDDFARAVNLSDIDSVEITKLPPVTDGELRLGNSVITGRQTIRGARLSELVYEPSGANITTSSFEFRVNGSPVDITCKLYHLKETNGCPTLSVASKNYLNVSTHSNVTLYGTLPCHDPDGDETVIEIVKYPQMGILNLYDRGTGEYTFTPGKDFSGRDEFTYVAKDKYGNYSASATVSLTVTKQKSSVVYADMIGSADYNAALTVTEEGIMSGTQVGGSLYFYPDGTVSREEFVVMAMNALGMREVTPVEKTVFYDDGDISDEMRDHIGVAYELGYIKGELDRNGRLCFYPERAVTRAEAACILASMINVATPTVTPTFHDAREIPTWAAPSIYSLNYMGIMTSSGGKISPLDDLTRADAASILAAVIKD